MRRREPARPVSGDMPEHLHRFRFDEWNRLPDEPTAEFAFDWRSRGGTKSTLEADWATHREIVAHTAYGRARRRCFDEHRLLPRGPR